MDTWDVRLLCSSYSSKDNDAVVELYGKTRDGKSITILKHGFKTYFFIIDPLESMAEQFLSKRTSSLSRANRRMF